MNTQVIDMAHFDVDEAMEELSRKRYSMPPAVIAALRQAGALATQRLLQMVADEDTFGKLNATQQMRLIELVLDRAYGKSETAASNELAQAKLGNGGETDHAKELEEIEKRARSIEAQRRNQRRLAGVPKHEAQSPRDILNQIDSQHGFSKDGPYPSEENLGERVGVPSPRNRPVPPKEREQNVVALRRGRDHE